MSCSMTLHKSPYFDYWLSLPDGFEPSERLPLIVFLHGAGECGPDTQRVRIHGIPKIIEREPWCDMRVITLSPQCQENRIWNTQIYELKKLIDEVAARCNADADRISITGLSMGGYGTWMAAQTFPNFFSAAAPVCGGGITWFAAVLKNMN
ncbi:MAG: alpha/beta hydrolase-fold protein, partial [Eubacteriales bacterium]